MTFDTLIPAVVLATVVVWLRYARKSLHDSPPATKAENQAHWGSPED